MSDTEKNQKNTLGYKLGTLLAATFILCLMAILIALTIGIIRCIL